MSLGKAVRQVNTLLHRGRSRKSSSRRLDPFSRPVLFKERKEDAVEISKQPSQTTLKRKREAKIQEAKSIKKAKPELKKPHKEDEETNEAEAKLDKILPIRSTNNKSIIERHVKAKEKLQKETQDSQSATAPESNDTEKMHTIPEKN